MKKEAKQKTILKNLKGNEPNSVYCKKTQKCIDYLIHLLLCDRQPLNLSGLQ